ncbi:MAG: NUDIX hydrolase [Lachnospiraceae bacterium]|nr:NUDIX hydrolase [Lachnospiraceae bacterium]
MSDNYSLAVGCIVRKEDEVLLVRHTYGGAAGQLLIPGGHCTVDELPEEAAQREVLEETHVVAKMDAMLGIRCGRNGWYALLLMDYVEGEPMSDGNENSEALFMKVNEALEREDVTHMTKVALRAMLSEDKKLLYSDEEYKKVKENKFTLFI